MMRETRIGTFILRAFASVAFIAFLLSLAMLAPPLRDSFATADVRFGNFLFGIRSAPLLHAFGWVTLLGNIFVVVVIAGAALVFMVSTRSLRTYAAGLCVSIIGAGITDYAIKILIGRPRPSAPIPAVFESSFSFPSGHAAAAVALYGFIAYVLCRIFPAQKTAIVSVTLLLIAGIGFSRLYLGVHFTSDVLAGYLLGTLWLLIGIHIVDARSGFSGNKP